ncbi:MAG: hypothetical protein ACE5SW_11420 [Nitrososphaeraceae archaeon]
MRNRLSKSNSLFVAIMLIIGIISLIIPSSYAEAEYVDYEKEYSMKLYDKDHKKLPFIQNIKCSNIIINGIDNPAATLQENMPNEMIGENDEIGAQDQWSGNNYDDALSNLDRNIVTCTNVNNNGAVEQAQPQTGSLTVKKEIFGCEVNEFDIIMNCRDLENDNQGWIRCADSDITDTIFCEFLPEKFFDIEVRDEQGNLVKEFSGSQNGETIQNLEPGTYTLNEIIHFSNLNQLGESQSAHNSCINDRFADGGDLLNINVDLDYEEICFEYEDELGGDCTTTNIRAGEDKICIVKNYIKFAFLDEQ